MQIFFVDKSEISKFKRAVSVMLCMLMMMMQWYCQPTVTSLHPLCIQRVVCMMQLVVAAQQAASLTSSLLSRHSQLSVYSSFSIISQICFEYRKSVNSHITKKCVYDCFQCVKCTTKKVVDTFPWLKSTNELHSDSFTYNTVIRVVMRRSCSKFAFVELECEFQLPKFVECECRLIKVYSITRNATHWFMSIKWMWQYVVCYVNIISIQISTMCHWTKIIFRIQKL